MRKAADRVVEAKKPPEMTDEEKVQRLAVLLKGMTPEQIQEYLIHVAQQTVDQLMEVVREVLGVEAAQKVWTAVREKQ